MEEEKAEEEQVHYSRALQSHHLAERGQRNGIGSVTLWRIRVSSAKARVGDTRVLSLHFWLSLGLVGQEPPLGTRAT